MNNSAARPRPRVAVLGGPGFAGRSILDELNAGGICAQPFSRQTGCDLLDEARALAGLRSFRPTHLVNCAAVVGSVNYLDEFAADVIDVNARLVVNTYRVAEQLAPVVVVNPVASCVYPGTMDVCEESRLWDGPAHPSVRSFGDSRRLLLAVADCYRRQKGLPSVNLIVPNMYGPHDSTDPNKTHALNALALKFVRAVGSNAPKVEVWGTGRPVREWLFVRDMARVVRQVIDEGARWPDPVNLAQNQGFTVGELVELVRGAAGYTGAIVYNPRYGDGAAKRVMDDRRFRSHFPSFAFTPIRIGIEATLDYYRTIVAQDHEHLIL
jgi:GDP-L-fucose synthase